MELTLTVNGTLHQLDVPPLRRLLDVLRVDLGLTGTKEGCGEGECGACTVLLDGAPVNACLVPVLQAAGRTVETIEGLADGDELHPVQAAFVDHGAVQCGFCTPGMVLSAVALLRDHPRPTREQIREGLVGNICRCTGYHKIVDAVEAAARNGGAR
jgi:carbon-monoxide dehydrogenase small subunit